MLAVLGALIVPVTLLDLWCLAPNGNGFIAIDFRGWLVGAYAAWLIVDALVTTLAVASGRFRTIRRIHLGGAVASGALLVSGTVATCSVSQLLEDRAERKREALILELSRAITLDAWSVVDSGDPREMYVTLLSTRDGDVSVGVDGITTGGVTVLDGVAPRRGAARGERTALRIPLKRSASGEPQSWRIAVTFFGANEFVCTFYEPNPEREYDGQFVHRPLPARSALNP